VCVCVPCNIKHRKSTELESPIHNCLREIIVMCGGITTREEVMMLLVMTIVGHSKGENVKAVFRPVNGLS
jgi:hypothetical protein